MSALTGQEFATLHTWLREQARWGPADRRGALNHLTAARMVAAVSEVRLGRTVSLANPIDTEPAEDNPHPAGHEMTSVPRGAGLEFALDRVDMNVHGNADSHLDALCHVAYQGELYNGTPVSALGPDGAAALSVDVMRNGVVGRAVLLDIPRLRGVSWLEPGEHVTAEELAAAEGEQRVEVRPGDLLFVRVGHRRRRSQLGPWDAAASRAGLHPLAARYLAERRVALLGSDGNNDTAPSSVPGVDFPVHVLAMQALGLPLLDYLQFEELLPVCEQSGHWSFLCVIAPLRMPAATGSPVNPIAIL
jgi:kynurenine formamidase